MKIIEDNVPLHTCYEGRHQQYRTPPLGIPGSRKAARYLTVSTVPTRHAIRRCNLIRSTARYHDLHEVLIVWKNAVPLRQFLKHSGRIILARIDHRSTGTMPPSGNSPGTLRAPHRKLSLRITNPVGSFCLRKPARTGQVEMPASARRIRFRTASAPAVLDLAISEGLFPSSNG